MSDLQVVRNQTIGYGAHGFISAGEHAHVKLLTTFRRNGTLKQLGGAELKAFLDVALAEAETPPGVTLHQIEIDTGVSYRHLLRIMPQLCQNSFCAIDGTDDAGNQIYRVAAYAWFGKANRSVPSSRGSNTRRPNPTARGSNTPDQLPHIGGSNTNVQLGTASNSSPNAQRPNKNNRSSDKMSHDKMSHDIGTSNNNGTDSLSTLKELDEKTLLLNVAIFRQLHVTDPKRMQLARRVPHAIAARWAQWVPLAPLDPYYKPVGYMIKVLENDPEAEPPDLETLLRADAEKRAAEERETEYQRQLAAGEIHTSPVPEPRVADEIAARHWAGILLEVQLQMTKATFDTWVKPTFARSYDDAAARLVIGVRNAYAKQWLDNRLYGIVERVAQHVIGKSVEIEFVLQTREDQ